MDYNNSKIIYSHHSAVVVLHEISSDSLVLTKRNEQLRSHPGQISFPGGLCEEHDQSFYDTALRELYEELGISRDRVELVTELKVEKTLAGIMIHPWFSHIESIHPYQLNLKEVSSILLTPMNLVTDLDNYREITLVRDGIRFKSCEFIPDNGIIWGATARIMKQLAMNLTVK